MLAGSILADLGAEVVVIEPPGGAAGRRMEPFLENTPGLERSLTWQALNRNKRGITLNLDTLDGVDLLGSLSGKFDVLVESVPTAATLSFGERAALPSKSIHCLIHPFFRDGPKANYLQSDLILMAASGSMGMSGEPDRPPIAFPFPQAMMETGAEAAIAVLAALNARDEDGVGQRIRVSARLASMVSAFSTPVVAGSGNPEATRSSGGAVIANVTVPNIFPCRDGYAVAVIAFGSAWGPMTNRLAAWAAEEGFLRSELGERDWSPFPVQVGTSNGAGEQLESLIAGIQGLLSRKTKDELWAEGRRRSLLVAPVMDMADIDHSPQFSARGLWNDVDWESRSFRIPARFAQMSNYSISTRSLAPMLSQHSAEVLRDELQLSKDEIQALFVHGVI